MGRYKIIMLDFCLFVYLLTLLFYGSTNETLSSDRFVSFQIYSKMNAKCIKCTIHQVLSVFFLLLQCSC